MQSDPQAVVYLALLTLVAILALIVVILVWQSERRRSGARVEELLRDRDRDLLSARKESVEKARSSLKGQIAEQMAPLLPGFAYAPADARFLGDPVDDVVFDGYTGLRDGGSPGDGLEIVLLEVSRGNPRSLPSNAGLPVPWRRDESDSRSAGSRTTAQWAPETWRPRRPR